MSTIQVATFRITGIFKNEKGIIQNFVQIIKAIKEQDALEQLVNTIGSHHRVKRRNIKIHSIEKLKEE